MIRNAVNAVKRFFLALFRAVLTVILLGALAVGLYYGEHYGIIPEFALKGSLFGIEPVTASTDFNGNEVDDYTDIMKGARRDALRHPKYVDEYYEGGYPPNNKGVCTDVIWRAFKHAGYDLKAMIDADIAARPWAYPNIEKADPNIDFRRVANLSTFFRTYAQSLTTDITDIAQWQAGDIVIFGNDEHIGIISNYRNLKGITFVIHNGGANPDREEDALSHDEVTGHYRFDASLINPAVLRAWQ